MEFSIIFFFFEPFPYKEIKGWDKIPSFITDIEGWDKILSFINIMKDKTKFHHL